SGFGGELRKAFGFGGSVNRVAGAGGGGGEETHIGCDRACGGGGGDRRGDSPGGGFGARKDDPCGGGPAAVVFGAPRIAGGAPHLCRHSLRDEIGRIRLRQVSEQLRRQRAPFLEQCGDQGLVFCVQ